ncbi:MAG: type II toxin-antitoxin system VapC family toxin [Deltaproteobacteria bacterium]|nr:type II toxin-antitoxin system VapC family toxin [Deltaproteobacteria bacterium]
MNLYLDTSAIVTLYVRESSSRRALQVRRKAERIATSMLAFPETLAAFGRMRREQDLGEGEHSSIVAAFALDWATWHVMPVDRRLLSEVKRLLKSHALTGADAVHLASAAFIHRRLSSTSGIVFACNDAQLREAAMADGLPVAW